MLLLRQLKKKAVVLDCGLQPFVHLYFRETFRKSDPGGGKARETSLRYAAGEWECCRLGVVATMP